MSEAHERNLLADEARFRGLLLTAMQFCEENDDQQLKALIDRSMSSINSPSFCWIDIRGLLLATLHVSTKYHYCKIAW